MSELLRYEKLRETIVGDRQGHTHIELGWSQGGGYITVKEFLVEGESHEAFAWLDTPDDIRRLIAGLEALSHQLETQE
jgi:hypothetical protein